MVVRFRFPDVGEGIQEGEVVEWLVKVGDKVKRNQNLLKVETAKAIVEVPSPVEGTIGKVLAKKGETIRVGQVIVVLLEKGEKPADMDKDTSTSVVGDISGEAKAAAPVEFAISKPSAKAEAGGVQALPAVRQMAKEFGIDLTSVSGTGAHGEVTISDLKTAIGKTKPTPAKPGIKKTSKYDFYGPVEHRPIKGLRREIAKNLSESWTHIPHVTHGDDIDVTELDAVRKEMNAKNKKVHFTFLPFIMKALVDALEKYPVFNAIVADDLSEVVIKKYYNIGIAVDTKDGLIVPVLKGVDQKSLSSIAKELAILADKTRERTVDLADLKGGSISITNVGILVLLRFRISLLCVMVRLSCVR